MVVDAKLRKSLESSAVACLGVETSKRSQAAQYVEKELCKPKKMYSRAKCRLHWIVKKLLIFL